MMERKNTHETLTFGRTRRHLMRLTALSRGRASTADTAVAWRWYAQVLGHRRDCIHVFKTQNREWAIIVDRSGADRESPTDRPAV